MSNLPFAVDQEREESFKPPHLRFEDDKIKDNTASMEAGRSISSPCIKVYVRSPGDDKCEVPYVVEKQGIKDDPITGKKEVVYPWEQMLKEKLHHKFISRMYFEFCMKSATHWKENQETLVEGTPIDEWAMLNKAEASNLKGLGILSIEQCSEMTETAMMAYGMGGRGLKDKAIAFLGANNDSGKAAEKITSLESSVKALAEKSEASENLASQYAQKIAMLEKMVSDGTAKTPVDAPDYGNWDKAQLVEEVKRKTGIRSVHEGWSTEKLLEKLA